MMRDTEEDTPFAPRDRERLQAGVRTRRRTRAVLMAGGSALLLAGVGVGLPAAFAQDHHAVTTPASTATGNPVPTPMPSPPSTGQAGNPVVTPMPSPPSTGQAGNPVVTPMPSPPSTGQAGNPVVTPMPSPPST
ncbi:hypothetical protein ACIGXM_13580, partial [Kitasatospora sp. NPDC052896]|uniref:hypothetical protein n=1 Tax=Kitasatospora sp. NPDC052896 TaxID=3364061 RepID=UPI0037CC8EB4